MMGSLKICSSFCTAEKKKSILLSRRFTFILLGIHLPFFLRNFLDMLNEDQQISLARDICSTSSPSSLPSFPVKCFTVAV